MGFASAYESKVAGEDGLIHYSPEETSVWRELVSRQDEVLRHRAAPEVLRGLELLDLPQDRVVQVPDLDARLFSLTGFGVHAVPAMISNEAFFGLLASRKFPVATFVRRREEMDYLKEPDIFHEVYGHCPLLTVPRYCDAIEAFGRAALELGPAFFEPIYRLFWYTVEFGLVRTPEGLRIYGAGITSSAKESVYALESGKVDHRPLDPVEMVGTDYRIDVLQARYYVIDGLETLYALAASLTERVPEWVRAARARPARRAPEALGGASSTTAGRGAWA